MGMTHDGMMVFINGTGIQHQEKWHKKIESIDSWTHLIQFYKHEVVPSWLSLGPPICVVWLNLYCCVGVFEVMFEFARHFLEN